MRMPPLGTSASTEMRLIGSPTSTVFQQQLLYVWKLEANSRVQCSAPVLVLGINLNARSIKQQLNNRAYVVAGSKDQGSALIFVSDINIEIHARTE